ncbi:hypothetical protein [Saccharopolyspora spinosa]|nr:hypothetical protein [Saccharopolyspora spinosa]
MPLVFILGLIAVALAGYGLCRLTQHFNPAGSVRAPDSHPPEPARR